MPYRIELSPEAIDHLGSLTARQRAIVADAIEVQLSHQPAVQTRNRKPMHENLLGPWVLRIGDIRVYYEIEDEPDTIVTILAIGTKDRNVLTAGGEVIDLTGIVEHEDDRS